MGDPLRITPDMPLDRLTALYPRTAAILLKTGYQCVGCYISRFHTVSDLAEESGMILEHLIDMLERIAGGENPRVGSESMGGSA